MKIGKSIVACLLWLQVCGAASHVPRYITGNVFKRMSNFVLDADRSFTPHAVKQSDIVFVKSDYLEVFFEKYHPHIAYPYILITHNSDRAVPGPFVYFLDDPKLIHWFGQNPTVSGHTKFTALPIGIANEQWPHGNTAVFEECRRQFLEEPRTKVAYVNFNVNTYPYERAFVLKLFSPKPYCTVQAGGDLKSYLKQIARHKFVVSPRGNGLDCHRTWEALLMGSIPIVISSPLDTVFEGLPVLIVSDWNVVTEELLSQKYHEFLQKTWNFNKMYAQYWIDLITSYKKM